jgi:RNA polymerase sigma-70 factor (ECF subfamily)
MATTSKADRTMVLGIINGSEKSLNLFYRKFHPSLRGFLSKKVSNNQDMEEILQDVMLASIDALRNFSFKCSLFTYLCSIANHKTIDYYRKKRLKNIVFSKMGDIESIFKDIVSPENTFDEAVLKDKIKATFAKIHPRQTLILKLKYIQGYSVSEIARKLNISYKSTESQLFRARQAFATQYSL